ncbi:hypothetical protein Tco_1177259, partial [Tanacetum coccineum]
CHDDKADSAYAPMLYCLDGLYADLLMVWSFYWSCYLYSFLGVFPTGFSLGKVFLRRQSCDADSVCGSLWMASGNKFFAFWVELVDGDVSGEFGWSQTSF